MQRRQFHLSPRKNLLHTMLWDTSRSKNFAAKSTIFSHFVSSSLSSSSSSLSSRWSRLGRELRTLKKAVDLWLRFGDQDIIAAPPYFMIIIILLLLIVIIITNHHHCHMMIRRFWASQWRRSTSLVCSNVRRNTPRLQRVFSTSPRLTYNVIIFIIVENVTVWWRWSYWWWLLSDPSPIIVYPCHSLTH